MTHQRLLPVCEEDAVGDIWACTNTECYHHHVPVNDRLHPQEHPWHPTCSWTQWKGHTVKRCKQT